MLRRLDTVFQQSIKPGINSSPGNAPPVENSRFSSQFPQNDKQKFQQLTQEGHTPLIKISTGD